MSYSDLTAEELLHAFMFKESTVSQKIMQTAGESLAGIAELVELIFEEMHTSLQDQNLTKKDIIAASMVTRLWRNAGVPIMFRRQIIGNRQQLMRWVNLVQVAEGKFWKLCETLVWNGQESRWRTKKGVTIWFDSKEVEDLIASADFSRVSQLHVFGASGLWNAMHVGDMVKRMVRLRRMIFESSHIDADMQKAIVFQVHASITKIYGGTWCACDFQGGRASTVEVRGDFIEHIFRHHIIHPSAIRKFTVHLSSAKQVRVLEWRLKQLTNLEKLTREFCK